MNEYSIDFFKISKLFSHKVRNNTHDIYYYNKKIIRRYRRYEEISKWDIKTNSLDQHKIIIMPIRFHKKVFGIPEHTCSLNLKESKERENKMENLEDLIINSQGINGIKNTLISKSIKYIFNRFKNNIGIEMIFDNNTDIKNITKIIKKYDKNFNYHIANSYEKQNPIINNSFILNINGSYMFISGQYEYKKNDDYNHSILVYIFGKNYKKLASKILKYLEKLKNEEMLMYSIVGTKSQNDGYWICTSSPIVQRTFDTLYFNNNIEYQIKKHLNDWIKNENIYKERGLIFKTGILLHGNPGTGKSSIATAIASYLNCNIINIDTSTFANISISEVVDAINADNTRYVILLDEIDSIFKSRDDENISFDQKSLTTKLLSFLDSVQSPNNVVFVATTNYYDRLDKAITRSGRFDKILEIKDLNKSTAIKMCEGFKLNSSDIKLIINNNREYYNPADLQNKILNIISKKNNEN